MSVTKPIVLKALELGTTLEGASRLLGCSADELKKLIIRHKISWPPRGNETCKLASLLVEEGPLPSEQLGCEALSCPHPRSPDLNSVQ